ncbi:helix-turn-helix transcriptional regulator [Actinoplanes sp. LDG1-06]|uniref:Helix-turn-helix transcriptional regulator n=1 Tax=Paractinoplanes ovalisporus TaxID=2810368 RepID=A0ABS2ACN1_9ACTN|nr:AraC family transcriptional regulator [Actinoplanes ovalisporus]MBM2617589.1 helix-turn-helix transcriptional regulator [Actinoplanes ovalisporus]
MAELTVHDTNGILRQPWVHPDRTSRGLGWEQLYVSTQSELPYQASFGGAPSHLVILHLNGPVTVRRGHLGLTSSRTVPPGGLFVHPAGKELTVELGGALDTVHAYLTDDLLCQAASRPVELAEELGAFDPLVEQLLLTLDGVMRDWEPSARTYVDHLGHALAAQLARQHSVRARPVPMPLRGGRSGLSDRQFHAVRELVEERLAEPLPLRELAAVTGLSVSQFGRQFKARTGLSPHQFLIQRRVDVAARLLRGTALPIAEVALRCGFSHQEHLTRVLRAHRNTTPAAMRVSVGA